MQVQEQGVLISGLHTTGDGYYETVIKGPDGDLIEIAVQVLNQLFASKEYPLLVTDEHSS